MAALNSELALTEKQSNADLTKLSKTISDLIPHVNQLQDRWASFKLSCSWLHLYIFLELLDNPFFALCRCDKLEKKNANLQQKVDELNER